MRNLHVLTLGVFVLLATSTCYGVLPVADAGGDQTILDRDGNGSEELILYGLDSSDSDGTIVSYLWEEDTTQLSTDSTFRQTLSVGAHTITLTVTDDQSDIDTDTVTITVDALVGPKQLRNLKETPTADRFPPVTALVWPANPGDADICLWADDMFAAVSITNDDTNLDHDFWLGITAQYGWNVTHFKSGLVDDDWVEFNRVHDAGSPIQNHTFSHVADDDTRPEPGVIVDYRDAAKYIEDRIPGSVVDTISYPWGNSNRDLAALVFLAGRGTVGGGNFPHKIDYLSTRVSGPLEVGVEIDGVLFGTSTNPNYGNNKYLRAWICAAYHTMDAAAELDAEAALAEMATHQDQLWVGLFRDVIRYGQERDTAVLNVTVNTTSQIEFTLTDDMDDTKYDHPLTVKVKMHPEWAGVAATQDGNPVETTVVAYNSEDYALVKAVPDQGTVVLLPAGTTYYLDAAAAGPTFDGSLADPWQTVEQMQTFIYGLPDNGAGDRVLIGPGSYGAFVEGGLTGMGWTTLQQTAPNRTDWFILQAQNPADKPEFSHIELRGVRDAYVEVNGLHVFDRLPHLYNSVVIVLDAPNQVRLLNLHVESEEDETLQPAGIEIGNGVLSDILVEGCEVHDVAAGIEPNGDNITVRNNHIHHVHGSAVKSNAGTNMLVEGNYIHDQVPLGGIELTGTISGTFVYGEPVVQDVTGVTGKVHDVQAGYIEITPDNLKLQHGFVVGQPVRSAVGPGVIDPLTAVTVVDWSHGSGLSVRTNGYTARNNLIHDYGSTAGIMVYGTSQAYSNMLFENNVIYDSMSRDVVFNDIGDNFVVRNNTFYGDTAAYFYSGYDGSGLSLYNNVIQELVFWDDATLQNVVESTNVLRNIKTRNPSTNYYAEFATPYTSLIIGYGNDAAFDALFTDAAGRDFTLALGSAAIGFGDPAEATATDILGVTRNPVAPCAGAYEYVSGGNVAPTADAGPDQNVTDSDDNGSEDITLDGSGSSDSDGTITDYDWEEASAPIATGVSPLVTFAVGVHTVDLTVTDDGSATGSDSVIITVNSFANVPPTANAGPDQNVIDEDDNGSEDATLDGSGSSDSDGVIVSYLWEENSSQIATGVSPVVSLDVGAHTIDLTVTDNGSDTGSDSVIVTVLADGSIVSGATWQSFAITPQADTFTWEFDAVPNQNNMDGLTVLSLGAVTGWGDCAVTTRFNTSGVIDSYDDTVYAADTSIPYTSGTSYHFRVEVDIPGQTYSVYVTPQGSGEQTLATDYAFRAAAGSPTTLNNWACFAGTGTHTVSNTTITFTGNLPPTADAGPDQNVTDTDDGGDEDVTLDGSGSSDSDGTIVSYDWEEASVPIGTGVSPIVTFTVGVHTVDLTVTDDDTATDTDSVVITVNPNSDTTVTYQIVTGDDDAIASATNFPGTDGASLYTPDNNYDAFMRWALDIPAGATVTDAYLSLCSKSNYVNAAVLRMELLDFDNCANFTADPYGWAVTASYVDWTTGDWSTNVWYDSPDLTSVVQEFIDRGGYASGAYIGIRGSLGSGVDEKQARSYDYNLNDLGAKLVVTYTTGSANTPPTANAGPDQNVTDTDDGGDEDVTLDGSGSSDSDGTITAYDWEEASVPIASGVSPLVTLSVAVHTIDLIVTDDDTDTDTDSVIVTVNPYVNVPPTADAGPNQNVTDTDDGGDEDVTLDGSGSSDSDGTITAYDWEEASVPIASGVSPLVTLSVAAHTIDLIVTDDDTDTDTDSVVITVSSPANVPPTADAGPDQNVTDTDDGGDEDVTLDGSASSDSDGTIVSYDWEEASVPIASGVSPLVTLSVAVHTIDLIVTDDDTDTDTDSVVITVNAPAANIPPTADAGPDQNVTDNDDNGSEDVTLDGSGSSDSDGTIVSYDWEEASVPIASGVSPLVTLSVAVHTIDLTVTDDDTDTGADSVVITVNPYVNVPPTADAGPDQNVTDTDDGGDEDVTLDGSASSDSDGTIAAYDWEEASVPIATGVSPVVTLSVAVHTIDLIVTDDDSATDTDSVVITVDAAAPSGFSDDFNRSDRNLHGDNGWTGVISGTGEAVIISNEAVLRQQTSAEVSPMVAGAAYIRRDLAGDTLASGGIVTWGVRIPLAEINPGGTMNGAIILGATGGDWAAGAATGYAVGIAHTNRDRVMLASFDVTAGLDTFDSSDAEITSIIGGTSDAHKLYFSGGSARVEFNPGTSTWSLYFRNDPLVDPAALDAGDLVGTVVDTSNTSEALYYMGAYFKYNGNSTTQERYLAIDDYSVSGLGSAPPSNFAPTADAGPDQNVTDTDDGGDEEVTLDGSGSSDSDGTITDYDWEESSVPIATGVSPVVTLSVAVHTIDLTVTDDDTDTDTDSVIITVNPYVNVPPTADAGPDQNVTDTDDGGDEDVTLDGSGSSDSDGTIASYDWEEASVPIATGVGPVVTLSVAVHTIDLTVTDDDTATDIDSVVITVDPAPAAGPNLEVGVATGIDDSWTTVTLASSYTSMVVVGIPNYDDTSDPMVVRIQNASGNSFDVRVDPAGGAAPSPMDVHWMVVEEGVYTQGVDGATMEAAKYTSTVTDRKSNWNGEAQTYANSYTSPVVLGQVMTYNDAAFSFFWCSNGSRTAPPSSSALVVGKGIAEDPVTTRADETVGYIVIEEGSGTINGIDYVTALGADGIKSVTNSPPYSYSFSGLTAPNVVVATQAAMDGNDGAWAMLYGSNPLSTTSFNLAVDEDVAGASERNHTGEQVGYIVFD